MKNKNPNVILLMNESININKFIDNLKKDWNYKCIFEILEQEKSNSYQFKYNNMLFVLSGFNNKFPEDISDDIANSNYTSQGKEIYCNHTNFCMLAIVGDNTANINMSYVSFTRIVMSLLLSHASNQCFVYDIRSRQVIDKEIYMKMFDNMKKWHKNNEEIFPIDWYVNYIVYKNKDKFNAVTLGVLKHLMIMKSRFITKNLIMKKY